MMTKPVLLLAALTLCCCIATLHATPWRGCLCRRTVSGPIPKRVIKKMEVYPISGNCRKTEIIITRRDNIKVCVDPDRRWIKDLLAHLQNENEASSSTTVSPTASTSNF